MCFPFLFRGALDVQSHSINEQMKMACSLALAEMARLPVPECVEKAYEGRHLEFGPDYIVPTPFDPRLMTTIPLAVAKAAVESGVAKNPISDWDAYKERLHKMWLEEQKE